MPTDWRAVEVDPNNENIVYAGASDFGSYVGTWSGFNKGVFKSVDGGNNWERMQEDTFPGNINVIAVDFLDSNNIYMGKDSHGLYKFIKKSN